MGWDADRLREFMSLHKLLMLLLVLCQNPLFGIAIRDVLFLAQIVHHLLAFEAQSRLQGVWTIVYTGMYYLELID